MTVNGRSVEGDVEPRTHLADFLREELLLTGTHLGCEQGVCGACTVMIDGRPARSCIALAVSCDAADVRTIESFDDDPLMEQLRDAFTRHHGLQCGFCTPGLLATAYDVVRRLPDCDSGRIRKEISGNLCRCTGYQGAVSAIQEVIESGPEAAQLTAGSRSRSRVTSSRSEERGALVAAPARSSVEVSLPDDVKDGVILTRQVPIAAPVDRVWQVLCDIPAVVDSIPGARLDGPPDGDVVRGRMVVAVGPMEANFAGAAKFSFGSTDRTGRVIGRGRDRLSRSSLDGALEFVLREVGWESCVLQLDCLYELKGPLAQFGRPAVVAEVADRLLRDIAGNLAIKANGGELDPSAQKPLRGTSLMWLAIVGFLKSLFGRK